jgi:hypothetical protein
MSLLKLKHPSLAGYPTSYSVTMLFLLLISLLLFKHAYALGLEPLCKMALINPQPCIYMLITTTAVV